MHITETAVVSDTLNGDGSRSLIKYRLHFSCNAVGKTADGVSFRITTAAQETFSLGGSAHFIQRSYWRTAHHSGYLVLQIIESLDAVQGAPDFKILRVYIECE